MKKITIFTLTLFLLLFLLAACGDNDEEPTPTAAQPAAVEPTEAPVEEVAEEPTAEPELPAEEPTAEPVVAEPTAEPEADASTETGGEETTSEPDAGNEDTAVTELFVPRDIQVLYDRGMRSPDGNPGPNYWQNHSVHNMSITVTPPDRTVYGTQTIQYTNNSPYPLQFIGFRTYQNVRLPEAQREVPVGDGYFTDGLTINEFSIDGEPAQWTTSLPNVQTVKLIPLPTALPPGGTVEFAFDWQFDLGEAEDVDNRKEGAVDDTTFYLAYFFPRVGIVSEPDLPAGTQGWDTEEYTYRSGRELNNEFADFTFEVNVPPNYVVWATGDLLNPEEVLQPEYHARLEDSFTSDEVINIATPEETQSGQVTAQEGTVTWRWQADNVLDVALGLSDHYVWDASSVVVEPDTGRRVSVQAAYNPEAEDFAQMVDYAKNALFYASTELPGVPYPYPKMTGFHGNADEEYPMMFNDSAKPEPLSQWIAAHEILHTYFPFYMGTNEQRYPMLDEGLTTAFEYGYNIHDQGQAQADALFKEYRSAHLAAPASGFEIPIITPADSTRGAVTSANAYDKASLGYLGMQEIMGEEAFKAAMQEFIARWNGKHPLPWDLFNTFNDVAEEDLTWFIQNWFFETNYMDLMIENVAEAEGGYAVDVSNVGGLFMPFDVVVSYADGSTEALGQSPTVWQESADSITVMIETDQEIDYVILDGGIYVDATMENDGWPEGIVAELQAEAALAAQQAFIESIVMVPVPAEATPGYTAVMPEGWTPDIQPPSTIYFLGGSASEYQLYYATITDLDIPGVLAQYGVTDPDALFVGDRSANGLEWSIYQDGSSGANVFNYAATEVDGTVYIILLVVPITVAEPSIEGIFFPAIDNFVIGGE